MNRGTDRLFTFVNSGMLKFALLLIALCSPLHVAHAQMSLLSGSNQSGLVSTTLPNPLSVRFTGDISAHLTWTVTSNNATIQESGSTTYDPAGGFAPYTRGDVRSIHLILGASPGDVTVNAHCGGCDVGIDIEFDATINGSNGISATGGGNQSGLPGTTLATPLSVTFSGVSNATLQWRVTSGTATFQESGSTTYTPFNGSGQTAGGQTSSVHLVLGNTPGAVTVTASCSSGCDSSTTQSFTETITAPPSNTMSIASGDNQSGVAGSTLPAPLAVSFSGAPVGSANVTLDWQVVTGNATIQESSSGTYTQQLVTSAGSSASIHLVLGSSAGSVTVAANCSAGCTAGQNQAFTATIAAAPSNTMSVASGDGQSGVAGSTLPAPLTASFSGAPVGSAKVTLDWQVLTGNATIQESNSSNFSQQLVTSSGSSASIHLVLGPAAGSVTVAANCSAGCTAGQNLSFNETITAASTAVTLSIYDGNSQTGAPGSTLPKPLQVLLTPPTGFEGGTFPVQWYVESGSATLVESGNVSYTENVVMSPSGGGATSQVSVALGANTGNVSVSATCQACTPSTRVFQLVSAANGTATLQKLTGDNQTGAVGSASDTPLVVQLGVPGNTAFSGQTINWTVLSGSATLSSSITKTDEKGHSQITFNYGNSAGPVTIEASSIAGNVTFTATAYNATLAIASGDNQTGGIGSTLAPFVVQVTATQTAAKGLAQVPVQWKVTSGSAILAAATTLTSANGQASNSLTLGANAGNITVTATIAGTGAVSSTFTAHALGSAGIASLSGNNQTGPVGAALQPFVLQVVSNGVSQPGVAVDWTVTQGGGKLAQAVTLSDASGHATNTLTLGSAPGVNVVQASIGSLGVLSFTAFASTVTGGNSQFSIVSGNNQGLTPGQPSKPLIVKLLSAQGQPVSGAVVQWSVNGQTGSLAASATPTDPSGQAQNTLTVILPGSYTVTAQLAGTTGVAPLTFTLGNGVANLPSLSPTQAGVAGVIDKACPALAALPAAQLTPAQQDLLKRCTEIVLASGNNPGQVPGALGQLTNNKALPQRQLANTVQVAQFGNLNTRLAELRQGVGGISAGGLSFVNDGRTLPLAMLGDLFRKDPKSGEEEVGKDFERWGFFATGMVERGGFDASSNRPGFNFNNDSLTAGVDYRFNADFVAGVALGYNRNDSSLEMNLGKLNADSFSLNGYFTWYHNNDFYIEGSLVMDWLSYDLSRNIAYQIADSSNLGTTAIKQTLTASPDGHQTSLSLSLGKDFAHGAWSVSPYLRGVYSHLSLSGFSESAADPNAPGSGLATAVDARSVNSALAVLGARLSYTTSFDWGVLVPNAVIEWNHELKNDPQTVVMRFVADPTQTPMSIKDQAPDQNYFNVGLGLNAVLPKGRSGFFLWEHLTGYAGAHENRYSVGIRIEF